MKDKTRLAITGVVAFAALAATLGGTGLKLDFDLDRDARADSRERGAERDQGGAGAEGDETNRALAGLKDFHGVDLAGPDDVVITHGAGFAVRAEGNREALGQLDVKVREGVLQIGRRDRESWFGKRHQDGAVIHVTLPRLDHVSLTGSGDMSVERLEGGAVSAELTGPGDLEIAALQADKADLTITGSGDLTASGRARQVSLNATGSGNVRARGLATEHAALQLIGSGDIVVQASGDADISLLGSGDAQVIGTTRCKVSKMGSGEAQCTAG